MYKINKETFLSYFLTYLLVVSLPLILILFYFQPRIKDILYEQIRNNYIEDIELFSNSIDEQIANLSKIPLQISYDKIMNSVKYSDNGYYRTILQSEFGKYVNSNSFIRSSFFYLRGSDYLCSTTNSYHVDTFNKYFFDYDNWLHKDFINHLNNSNQLDVRGSEKISIERNYNSFNGITFTFPIPLNNTNPYATCLFIVDDTAFKKYLEPSYFQEDYILSIYDISEDRVIISNLDKDRQGLISRNIADKILESYPGEKSLISKIGNIDYFITYSRSRDNNWFYIIAVPLSEVFYSINKEQSIFILLLLGLTIFELVIIYFFVNLTYSPMKKLKKAINQLALPHDKQIDPNIDGAIQLLEHLHDDNTLLQKISINKRKKETLYSILSGSWKNEQDLQERLNDAGILFEYDYNLAIIISFPNISEISEETTERIIESVLVPGLFHYYLLKVEISNYLCLIINSKNNDDNDIGNYLTIIYNNMLKASDRELVFFVGNYYSGYGGIKKSYFQALSMMDYLNISGNGDLQIIYYKLFISNLQNSSSFPLDLVNEYRVAVFTNNYKQVLIKSDDICARILSSKFPPHIIRNIFFEVISIQMHYLKTHDANYNIEKCLGNKVLSVLHIGSREKMIFIVDKLSDEICNLISSTVDTDSFEKSKSIEKIFEYIQLNFSDIDFSVQKVADEFEMSSSSFSHYFKRNTGENFMSYIMALRMRKAKELLLDTEMSIKEISRALGYWNDTSFIRLFKKVVRQTPGNYRKKGTVKNQ